MYFLLTLYFILELRGNTEQCSIDKACIACANYNSNFQTFNGISSNYRTIFPNMYGTKDFDDYQDVCCAGCRPVIGIPRIFDNGGDNPTCTLECLPDQSLTQQFQPFYQQPQFNQFNPGNSFGGGGINFFPFG